MHSYISYNKLASLYVCFAMLHTTLHNETEIINRKFQNRQVEDKNKMHSFTKGINMHNEQNGTEIPRYEEETQMTIFDMIVPNNNEDIRLWPKTGDYVTIPYALDPSLSADQQRTIPGVLRSIEAHTCIRFAAQPGPCDGGDSSDGGAKLCFRCGRERTAHLGRWPGGPQPVTLGPGDGPYWVLHLVGHVLGLPHPHTCRSGLASKQDSRNANRTGCVPRHCPWRRSDTDSALQLTPEELADWWPPQQTSRPSSASALLSVWRARRDARPSHGDLLALHELYRCWDERPRCPRRHCQHDGLADARCRCVCPPGFAGEDCQVRVEQTDGDADSGDEGCVHHMKVGTELTLSPSELASLGAAEAGDQCVLRVRTSSQRLRILVTTAGTEEQSRMSPNRSVMLYAEALVCSVKMYVFQSGGHARTFCLLDYLEESLLLNVAGAFVDVLFRVDSSREKRYHAWERTRVVLRSVDDLSKGITDTATAAPATISSNDITTQPEHDHVEGKLHSELGDVPTVGLVVLTAILFALMGFNFLAVFCIKKFWEYKYGTAGIYRGTGADWAEEPEDEEEPEDWQVKVEYSNSFDAIRPGWEGMEREASVPQAEMTDLELFRSMYGVPAPRAPPPDDGDDELPDAAETHSLTSEESLIQAEPVLPARKSRTNTTSADTTPTGNTAESASSATKGGKVTKSVSSATKGGKPTESVSSATKGGNTTESCSSATKGGKTTETVSSAIKGRKATESASSATKVGKTTESASSTIKGGKSDSYLKPEDPALKTRKRVSFSDDIGEPLHVHSDAPLEKKVKSKTSTATKKPSQLKQSEDVCISVPFSGDAQPPPPSDSESDSDEDSDESSCCDTSSSSSYHEDDDDLKKKEPGFLHGLTTCFQKKQNNDSSEIQ